MATDRLVRALQTEYNFVAIGGLTSVVVLPAERWELSREARRLANALSNLGVGDPLITETVDNRGRRDITVSGVVDEMLAPDPEVVGREMYARVMAPLTGEAPIEPKVARFHSTEFGTARVMSIGVQIGKPEAE